MTKVSARSFKKPKFVCPFCGHDEIAELAISVVLHNVSSWDSNGKPLDYEPPEVDWETDFRYALLNDPNDASTITFECRKCCEHFEKPKRASKRTAKAPSSRTR